MQFNSVQSGSFLTCAKSVVDATNEIYEATRNTGLDVTQITNQNRQSRADLKVVAERAARDTRAQSMKSAADRKVDDIKIDLYKYKKEKLRKAGILAANMYMQTAALMGQEAQEERQNSKIRAQMRQENDAARQDSLDDYLKKVMEKMGISTLPGQPTDGGDTVNQPAKILDGGDAVKEPAKVLDGGDLAKQPAKVLTQVPTPVSAKSAANAASKMSKDQVRNLAINTGFSPQAANIVVGISGGESGRDPSNSTKRSGLYAKTGEDSVGLMQINYGYHKDKGWLHKVGVTKRDDLFDPATNMRAAKYLYDGRGGNFQDWTVFNNGDYRQSM